MNIELETRKGRPVTIIYHDGRWIFPAILHKPKYIADGNRVLGPIMSAVQANDRREQLRSTYVRAEAECWARKIVSYFERMGY